jgi:hypothetical protein
MRAVAVLAVLLLAGCVQVAQQPTPTLPTSTDTATTTTTGGRAAPPPANWDPDAWRDVPCDLPEVWNAAQTPLPDLMILDFQANLHRFTWDKDTPSPVGKKVPTISGAIVFGQNVVTAQQAGEWRLILRDGMLNPIKEVKSPQVAAMGIVGEALVVVTRHNVTTYDAQLEVLGKTPITVPAKANFRKQVDVLRVADGHAYWLDDSAQPFTAYRFDVRSPAAPREVYARNVTATVGPTLQWLGPQSWWLEENFVGPGAYSRAVVAVGIEDGRYGTRISLQNGTYAQPGTGKANHERGYLVQDSTFRLPAWAIVGSGNASIARVDIDDRTIERSCMTPVTPDIRIREHKDLLITWGRNQMHVWEARDEVRLRVSAGLPVVPFLIEAFP